MDDLSADLLAAMMSVPRWWWEWESTAWNQLLGEYQSEKIRENDEEPCSIGEPKQHARLPLLISNNTWCWAQIPGPGPVGIITKVWLSNMTTYFQWDNKTRGFSRYDAIATAPIP